MLQEGADDKKKYPVAAFVDLSINAANQVIVLVEYEGQDDKKWETLAYMEEQLGKAMADKLVKPLKRG
jgi:hypothetical protein